MTPNDQVHEQYYPIFVQAAHDVLDKLPEDIWVVLHEHTNATAINPERMEPLADAIQAFIAELVASIINAGSEREAVMENEALSAAILTELKGWGPEE